MPTLADHSGRWVKRYWMADGEVVVGVEQAGGAGDDAVAVVVGVAGPGDVELVLVGDHGGHGVGARSSPCGCGRPSRGS